MKPYYLSILIAILLSSCYELNDNHTVISKINYSCEEGIWPKVLSDYSISNVKDSSFLEAIDNINRRSSKLDVLFFKEEPLELIAVSKDYSEIRFVFNPLIRNRVLDGVSIELNPKEEKRIKGRISKLLLEYGCVENE